MPKEIAVYVNNKGETVSLYDQGNLRIYNRSQGKWALLREKEFFLRDSFVMRDLRNRMGEVVTFLDSCKTFVGLAVTGIPYFELEKAGCSVWEFQGDPLNFLDYVLEKEEAEEQSSQKDRVVLTPVETFPGCFRISLKDIQEGNTGLTSKQVLMPFVRSGKFYQLEVICNHIPPWLEGEIQLGNLESRSEVIGKNEIKLVINKKTCRL